MSVAFLSIAIFALISITYGNKAADDTKKESVRQGKSINLFYCVFLIFKVNEEFVNSNSKIIQHNIMYVASLHNKAEGL